MANNRNLPPVTTKNSELSDELFLGDPTISGSLKDDPLLKFLFDHWKQILLIGGGIFAAWYVFYVFKSTHQANVERAADTFSRIRIVYDELRASQDKVVGGSLPKATSSAEERAKEIAAAQKELEETRKKIDQLFVILKESPEPYNNLSLIYQHLVKITLDDKSINREPIESLDWRQGNSKVQDRFFGELNFLATSRALLDDVSKSVEALKDLKELAKEGHFFNIPAALIVSKIAATPEQKAEALVLVEDLLSKHPKQRSLLEEQIKALKG